MCWVVVENSDTLFPFLEKKRTLWQNWVCELAAEIWVYNRLSDGMTIYRTIGLHRVISWCFRWKQVHKFEAAIYLHSVEHLQYVMLLRNIIAKMESCPFLLFRNGATFLGCNVDIQTAIDLKKMSGSWKFYSSRSTSDQCFYFLIIAISEILMIFEISRVQSFFCSIRRIK